MRIIVGRTALLYNTNEDSLESYKGDADFWVSNQEDKEELLELYGDSGRLDICVMPKQILDSFEDLSKPGVAVLEDLLAIKLSHFQYDIFWKKHKQDILALKKLTQGKYNTDLYLRLKEHWAKEFSSEKSHLSLYKTKDEFFDDFVPKAFEHDYLHVLVADKGIPVYTRCLKDGQEVLVDKDKFDKLPFLQQVRMFKEEVAVIALERWVIPSLTNERLTQIKKSPIMLCEAWDRSVHKTVTALTKNWASEFICLNIEHFTTPLYDEMLNALSILNLKEKYKMNETLNYEQIKRLYETRGEEAYDDGYYDFHEFLLDYGDDVEGFEFIEQDGGGEGGAEHCESIIKVDGTIYKITYRYFSHHGFDFDYAEARVVKPVRKFVTVYE